VIVSLSRPGVDAAFKLDEKLDRGVSASGAGEYDGNEIAVDGSEAIFYAYGPDADALWKVMKPIVEAAPPKFGSYATLRYGGVDNRSARQVRVRLP